jgi:hypothetical protein
MGTVPFFLGGLCNGNQITDQIRSSGLLSSKRMHIIHMFLEAQISLMSCSHTKRLKHTHTHTDVYVYVDVYVYAYEGIKDM